MTIATASTVGELFLERVVGLTHRDVLARLEHDWVAGGDELTPTSKLRRRAIADKYATEIEGMYAGS
jgi:long-subunit acyl-CoA synthetase (AMP-forming)